MKGLTYSLFLFVLLRITLSSVGQAVVPPCPPQCISACQYRNDTTGALQPFCPGDSSYSVAPSTSPFLSSPSRSASPSASTSASSSASSSSSSSPDTTTQNSDPIKAFFTLPAIIGVAVGGAALVIIILTLIICLCRRNRNKYKSANDQGERADGSKTSSPPAQASPPVSEVKPPPNRPPPRQSEGNYYTKPKTSRNPSYYQVAAGDGKKSLRGTRPTLDNQESTNQPTNQ